MKISACYIVKNEEKNIGKSIDSLQGAYDELIVVDTGSTDGTVAAAQKRGADIYYFPWKNDFSLARNYAIDKAAGDWIIFLDADEYYDCNISIRDYLCCIEKNNPAVDAVLIPLYEAHLRQSPPMQVIRFFRNDSAIRYQGAIHEQISKHSGQLNITLAAEMVFVHTGYHPANMEMKSRRNLQLLLSDIEKNGEQEAYYYYLAECYFGLQEYEKAIIYVKKAIAAPVRHYREEANYYHILLESMRQCQYPATEMAAAAAEAINKFPDMPEFYGEQGIILSSMGKLDEAFAMLNTCVKKYEYSERQKHDYGYFTDEIMGVIYARLARIAIVQNKTDFAMLAACLAGKMSQGKWGVEEYRLLQEENARQSRQQVVICIPVYKSHLTVYEQASLQQLNKVLGAYPRVFVAPESLAFDYGEYGIGIKIERFPDYFFTGVLSYSALMLQKEFYQRFADYEYMLLYQTDAFVFSDRLLEFCSLGFDYIGAPVPMTDPLWHFIGGRVGNGGLSLRKVDSAIRMLEKWDVVSETPLAAVFWQWEDIYWGYCSRHPDWNFKVPDMQTALNFAVQDNVSHAHRRMADGWRPFGCHGWWQMDYDFWQPIIEACGYKFPCGENPSKERYPRLRDYLQSRSSLNIHYLWGLYDKGRLSKMLAVFAAWLNDYPAEHRAWQLIMEKLICICRIVEADNSLNLKFKIMCQRKLAAALLRSLNLGIVYPVCRNLLITMLPYLQKYDYPETKELAKAISTEWWSAWKKNAAYGVANSGGKRKIVVLSKVIAEADLVESFVRHTMNFADAIIIDVSLATEQVKDILAHLEAEGMPLILHDAGLRPEQVKEDMDFVLSLAVTDFLVPQQAKENVRKYLEQLKNKADYTVETGNYAFYLPYAYRDKFVLAQPLVRQNKAKSYKKVIYGGKSMEEQVEVCRDLYLVQMVRSGADLLNNGMIPPDMELTDISGFAACPELKYTASL